ncbi:MAG: hypothetical protein ABEK16_00550, partial [Candidatus Nanohalobium sp.]
NYSTERTEPVSRTLRPEDLPGSTVGPVTDLEVVSLNSSQGRLEVAFRNNGKEPVWTMVQAGEGMSRVKIPVGETGRHVIKNLEGAESYKVFQGEFRNQYSYSDVKEVEEESRPSYTLLIVVLIIMMVFLAAGYVVYEFTSISMSSLR